MPKSYDDPDPVDRIDLAHVAREAKERADRARERHARRSHQAFEPSSAPPPPDTSWPPKPIEIDGPSIAVQAAQPSFGAGFAHLGGAAGRISKRVAVLLGAWGTVTWMGAVALAYWTSHSVVGLDRYAKDEAVHAAERASVSRDIEGLRSTINDQRVKIAALEATINMLQQEPIQPKKRRP